MVVKSLASVLQRSEFESRAEVYNFSVKIVIEREQK